MSRIRVADREGREHDLEAPEGWSVMEIVREAGLPIEAACGGCCASATCHVYVDPGWHERLPERGREEEGTLDLAYAVKAHSRLSSQIRFSTGLDGLSLRLAPEPF